MVHDIRLKIVFYCTDFKVFSTVLTCQYFTVSGVLYRLTLFSTVQALHYFLLYRLYIIFYCTGFTLFSTLQALHYFLLYRLYIIFYCTGFTLFSTVQALHYFFYILLQYRLKIVFYCTEISVFFYCTGCLNCWEPLLKKYGRECVVYQIINPFHYTTLHLHFTRSVIISLLVQFLPLKQIFTISVWFDLIYCLTGRNDSWLESWLI